MSKIAPILNKKKIYNSYDIIIFDNTSYYQKHRNFYQYS